jgi:hypothetical protein
MIGGRELTDATLRLAEDLLSRSSRPQQRGVDVAPPKAPRKGKAR